MHWITLYHDWILAGLLIVSILLLVTISFLHWRLTQILRGTDGKSLEKHIRTISKDYQNIQNEYAKLNDTLASFDKRISHHISGVGLVKFNPFAGSGDSKPSFALALISEKGDGVILSTLHARDSVSFFTKEIRNNAPASELSEEEERALEKARKLLHDKR